MTTDITTRLRLERSDLCVEAAIAIEQLRERLSFAEAQLAATRGTVAQPAADEPATFTHNVPPSAPR